MRGPVLAVFAFLGKYPANSMPRGVDCKEDRAGGGIIDQNESRGVYDSIFELLHGLLVPVLPLEVHTLASEVNKGVCNHSIVFDPDVHVPGEAKECADICEVFAQRPRGHFVGLRVLWDAAIIHAFVPEDSKLGCGDGDFGCGDSCSGMPEAVEDAVDIAEVFPHEAADARIHGDGLESPTRGFIVQGRAADGSIVDKWSRDLWNFWLEGERNLAMKNGNCVSGSLQENGALKCTKRRLKTGEVT